MDDCLESFGGATIFSTLDCNKGLPRERFLYTLERDTSNVQIRCVLMQDQQDDAPVRPIGYSSHSLNESEHNYDTTHRECLPSIRDAS